MSGQIHKNDKGQIYKITYPKGGYVEYNPETKKRKKVLETYEDSRIPSNYIEQLLLFNEDGKIYKMISEGTIDEIEPINPPLTNKKIMINKRILQNRKIILNCTNNLLKQEILRINNSDYPGLNQAQKITNEKNQITHIIFPDGAIEEFNPENKMLIQTVYPKEGIIILNSLFTIKADKEYNPSTNIPNCQKNISLLSFEDTNFSSNSQDITKYVESKLKKQEITETFSNGKPNKIITTYYYSGNECKNEYDENEKLISTTMKFDPDRIIKYLDNEVDQVKIEIIYKQSEKNDKPTETYPYEGKCQYCTQILKPDDKILLIK
ncbi:hypothetical protein [Candidatus Phytoplasma asteris]|uniref:DUF2963 domain-containing protein n=2 Tax=16SrI (Aster yellows group) TaxID=3042590 RepID=A0A859IAW4_9MOLU|nr:MAG: hypothetical protein RP166_1020 [Rapeseed phyllody phytoplasma]